jgi:hypothetical protein
MCAGAEQVRAGDVLDERQIRLVRTVIEEAEERTGLTHSVHVGPSDGDPRVYAERLLAALGSRSASATLVHVDPVQRRIEIVTGAQAAVRVDDRACALAALSMSSSFAGGDLAGGIVTGVRMLAEAAGASGVGHGTHHA